MSTHDAVWEERFAPYTNNPDLLEGLSDEECEAIYEKVRHSPDYKFAFTEPWQCQLFLGRLPDVPEDELPKLRGHLNKSIAFYAASAGDLDLLQQIEAQHPALLVEKDSDGRSIAHSAAFGGSVAALEWIQGKYPALLTEKGNNGATIAHLAACSGTVDALKWIQEKYPELLSAKSNKGGNIAHFAAWDGSLVALEWVQRECPDLLTEGFKNGATIAHSASSADNVATLKWIQRECPELLSAKSNDGRNIAHFASQFDSVAALEWIQRECPELLSAKAKNGTTIKHSAVYFERLKSLAWIAKHQPELLQPIAHLAAYAVQVQKPAALKWLFQHFPSQLHHWAAKQSASDETVRSCKDSVTQYQHAQDDIKNKKYVDAISKLDDVISFDSEHSGAYLLRGLAKLKQGGEHHEGGLTDLREGFQRIMNDEFGPERANYYLSHIRQIDLYWCIQQLPPEEQIPLLEACLDKSTPLGARFWSTASIDTVFYGYNPVTQQQISDHLASFSAEPEHPGDTPLEDKGETPEEVRATYALDVESRHYGSEAENLHLAIMAYIAEANAVKQYHGEEVDEERASAAIEHAHDVQALLLAYLEADPETHDALDLHQINQELAQLKDKGLSTESIFSSWKAFKKHEVGDEADEESEDDLEPRA